VNGATRYKEGFEGKAMNIYSAPSLVLIISKVGEF
jgi:hypothetical protein